MAITFTGISPGIGSTTGGGEVTLTGTGFQLGATVTFGGVSSPYVAFNSSTRLIAQAPAHAVGFVTVQITNPDTTTASITNGFLYEESSSIEYAFTVEASPDLPVAIVAPTDQDAVVGSVVRLDGRSSFSPAGLGLTYSWSFKQAPIGSQVSADGFKDLEEDSSVVSFAPDIIGLYVVELVVNDGSFDSLPVDSSVNTKVVLVPQNLGIVPDVSWVWNFLSDFWTRVEQRTRFETIWSAAVQIIAAEQLKLWQYDYNKSIQDIQELIQKRWLKYEPALPLDATLSSLILAEDQAGLNAATFLIDTTSNAPQSNQPLLSNLVTVPTSEGNFSLASYGGAVALGRLLQLGDLAFTMARAGVATRAVNRGADGTVIPTSGTFHGSAFSTGMVGMLLRILNGAAAGTYEITAVTASNVLTVKNLDGSATSFPTSTAGLSYTIFPTVPNFNAFFADQNLVPTQQSALPWRFSSTLTSTQYDFEAQGVSPGDVLTLQITRTDTLRSSNLNVQIVAVDRGRISFVFNTMDLVVGTPSRGLSAQDQVQLANDLQVPGLMTSPADNSLVYTDQAQLVKATVSSANFKRQFFEQTLSTTSAINVGPFSITISPVRIIRNSKVLVDATIKSIPSLQEYVKQPDVVEQDGNLFQVSEGQLFPLTRKPYVVFENADYVIDDEESISGTCAVTNGSDLVVIPFGDLFDRSVKAGDTLNITNESAELETFRILAVMDAQTVRVAPALDFTDGVARFELVRDVPGTFIRFVSGLFTKTMPAPQRLWAEVTFFDNNDSVENNFGVLVGVLRSDLSSVGATISYKNAVAGLMYALTNGPTVANLQLASQILLGLPFTTSAGTVIEIDPTFKINADGSPFQGRILIAAEDAKGNPIGITNIYFYPQGRQIPDPVNPGKWLPADPDLSGLAINPDTGKEYVVGDHVDRFVALSKGTQVQDYLTTAGLVQEALNEGNSAFALQRYHSFQLIVNADVTTAVDTDLVAQFIKKAKPTYTKLALALSKVLEDEITIDDSILFHRDVDVQDNISLSMPVSVSFDQQSVDGTYITIEGQMRSFRIFGEDLATTQGSLAVTSASGGFINARALESHEAGFLRKGYIVQITGGANQGVYLIDTVDSDTQITLQSVDFEGDSFNFETATAQAFTVYMPISSLVTKFSATVTNSSSTISSVLEASQGVAVGDLLVFYTTSPFVISQLYRVVSFDASARTIGVDKPFAETTGSKTIVIFREPLGGEHFWLAESDSPLAMTQVNTAQTAQLLVASTVPEIAALTYPGDVLVNVDTAEEFTVLDFDPGTGTFYFTPAAASSGNHVYRLERRERYDGGLSLNVLDRMPSDNLTLSARTRSTGSGGSGPDLTTTSGSATVSTVSGLDFNVALGVLPGDYLLVLEGSDSTVNVGYGLGVFPILSVSSTNLILTRELTATHNSPGILFGIQRRSSNER